MSHHLLILREDEYQQIQEQRRGERIEKQQALELQYHYSQEKQAELLKQRDLPGEMKSLKRRKLSVIPALWILSAVLGLACGHLLQKGQFKKAIVCEAGSISVAALMCFKWRSYLHKIRMKDEEIACAEHGWICPQIELYRQEGKSYC